MTTGSEDMDVRILNPDEFERCARRLRRAARRSLKIFSVALQGCELPPDRRDDCVRGMRSAFLVLGLTTPDIIRRRVTRPPRRFGCPISPDLILDLVRGANVQEGKILASEAECIQEEKLRQQAARRLRHKMGAEWTELPTSEKDRMIEEAVRAESAERGAR